VTALFQATCPIQRVCRDSARLRARTSSIFSG
jgi:hypothetical protein